MYMYLSWETLCTYNNTMQVFANEHWQARAKVLNLWGGDIQ